MVFALLRRHLRPFGHEIQTSTIHCTDIVKIG
jgi:hypothetical protein